MASSPVVHEMSPPTTAVKVPIVSLMLCCLLAVLLALGGCGGLVYYLIKSGRMSAGLPRDPEGKKPISAVVTHPVALDPMLANLADEDGHTFLRVGIVLAEADPVPNKKKEDEKPVPGANASLRDTILTVLGRQRSPDLLAADGKDKLKVQLREALQQQVPEAGVQSIYFTDFLVQR